MVCAEAVLIHSSHETTPTATAAVGRYLVEIVVLRSYSQIHLVSEGARLASQMGL